MENKFRSFYMDTDILDKALDSCDLGDGYLAKVRQYPHKDMTSELTHVIEFAAVEQLKAEKESYYHDYRMKFDVETKQLHADISALKSKLKIAVEALDNFFIKTDNPMGQMNEALCHARKALSEISSWGYFRNRGIVRGDLYFMFFDYFVKTGMAQDRAARHADRLADKIVNELTRTAMRQLQEQRKGTLCQK